MKTRDPHFAIDVAVGVYYDRQLETGWVVYVCGRLGSSPVELIACCRKLQHRLPSQLVYASPQNSRFLPDPELDTLIAKGA